MRLIAHILLAVLLGGSGCRTVAYYQQAVTGQCEMLRGQSSIDALVEDNATEPALRKQLQLVQELLQPLVELVLRHLIGCVLILHLQ